MGNYIRTEEHKKNMSLRTKGIPKTEEAKKNMSLARKGKTWEKLYGKEKSNILKKEMSGRFKDIPKSDEQKIKMKKSANNFILRDNRIKNLLKDRGITKNEKYLLSIIEKNNLPFNFVGNGKVVFKGYCPDFLSKNPKHIIELFGNNHCSEKCKNRDKKKIKSYFSLGYKTLIIWEWELKHEDKIVKKIQDFIK